MHPTRILLPTHNIAAFKLKLAGAALHAVRRIDMVWIILDDLRRAAVRGIAAGSTTVPRMVTTKAFFALPHTLVVTLTGGILRQHHEHRTRNPGRPEDSDAC